MVPQKRCREVLQIKNKTLHWSITGNEISIPYTQIFIQKSDKSWDVYTAHFEIDPEAKEYTYRYSPREGEMSGPESFYVESPKAVTVVASIPLSVEPLKVELPKTVCSK